MPDTYPILEVEPEWVLEPETMGSKDKFWYKQPEEDGNWLFKYPQPNTGQHWAEKIAAEVAELLQILHAKVELATFREQRGSVTESFARGGRSLYHGNQLLEGVVYGYDPAKEFHQSSHTLENIWKVMDRVFEGRESAKRAKLRIAEYLVLDAPRIVITRIGAYSGSVWVKAGKISLHRHSIMPPHWDGNFWMSVEIVYLQRIA